MMRTSLLLKLAASSMIFASLTAAAEPAAKYAERAERALAKKKFDQAVAGAEAAVAAAPQDAGYRMLLGRSYLESGRYQSAASSFADVLTLDASRGGAALSLALVRIGMGDSSGARTVLDAHGAQIAASDRGLALALTGDPAAGVALLEAEVRGGGSDAKTRQNLALSYALAGRWPEAKLMASYDLDAATVSTRIMEWSRFARDQQASAQVAALLGVAPGIDPGQPAQLALATSAATVQLAEVAPPPPVAMPAVEPAPSISAPTLVVAAEPAVSSVQFAARAEVVQAFAQPVILPKPAPAHEIRAPLYPRPTGGRFVVQIGAFDSAAVAEASWGRLTNRIGMLRTVAPSTATVVRGSATYHRLSVGGFATRSVAVNFCEQLRARGGQCFVRETAGDAPLQWVRRSGGTRLAAR